MLNADDARRMTENALSPDAEIIRPYVKHVLTKVAAAAKEGRREIAHPLRVLPGILPDAKEAVRKAIEVLGYTWTHHSNPDPGHPASSEYDTVSW